MSCIHIAVLALSDFCFFYVETVIDTDYTDSRTMLNGCTGVLD